MKTRVFPEELHEAIETWIAHKISGEDADHGVIKKRLTDLRKSTIPRSKLHRLEMVLNDISRNHERLKKIAYRIQPVFTDNTDECERIKVFRGLQRQNLISSEQYQNLKKDVKTMDFDSILAMVASTKIGRGTRFLPNTLQRLKDTAVSLSDKLEETNSKSIRCNLLAILDKLLSRRGISQGDYDEIVEIMG